MILAKLVVAILANAVAIAIAVVIVLLFVVPLIALNQN
jgi:hypothetical protein